MNMQQMEQTKLKKEFQRMEGLYGQIRNGEIYLYADILPCAQISGLDPKYIFEFEDKSGIGRIYEESVSIIRKCICLSLYGEVMRLCEMMKETQIFVYTGVYASIGLEELVSKKLAEINLKQLAVYEFYAVYCSAQGIRREQAVYDFLCNNDVLRNFLFRNEGWSGEGEVSLRKILKLPELKECVQLAQKAARISEPEDVSEFLHLPEFWDSWTVFLERKYESEKLENLPKLWNNIGLLEEAVLYRGSFEELLEMARLHYKKDPSMYWKVMQAKGLSHDAQRQLEIGKEALDKLDVKLSIRCDIALWMARIAFYAKEYAQAEHYCEEAFAFHVEPVNYFFAAELSHEPERLQKMVSDRLQKIRILEDNELNYYLEFEWQVLTEHQAVIIKFFQGDFQALIDYYLREDSLRSNIDMACGLALLILLLVKDREWKKGCRYVADRLGSSLRIFMSEYAKAVKEQSDSIDTDEDLFRICFLKWKDRQQAGPEVQTYLHRLDVWVHSYIREHFEEDYKTAAGFAAALGEVKESLGEKDGKQKELVKCRENFIDFCDKKEKPYFGHEGFSCKRAFEIHLQQFGMKDVG